MKKSDSASGFVFNIQKCSLHDGDGIRTLVFMKGCPLRCSWCSNPESQKGTPEIIFEERKCLGPQECGWCIARCPVKAIKRLDNDSIGIDRHICTSCGVCAEACPSKAISIVGKRMLTSDIIRLVEDDQSFYWRSGGGITVGGGDPVFQAEFTRQLLRACQASSIHTAIETAGYANFSDLEKISEYADLIMFDVKHIDSVKHKSLTGVHNELILANLKRLSATFPQVPIIVRTPIVPGFNDSEEVIQSIVNFISSISNLIKYELLPYHAFGEAKYHNLGRKYLLEGLASPDKEHMTKLNEIISDAGLA
jgi:glycyl-radical enzyme activating protein family